MRSLFGQVVESCGDLISLRNNVMLHFNQLARVALLYPDHSFDRLSIPITVFNSLMLLGNIEFPN